MCPFLSYMHVCMYVCMPVCIHVYVRECVLCVIFNNSALKFSRGRGREARPWKPILHNLCITFFSLYTKTTAKSCSSCLDEVLRVYHALLGLHLITGKFHVRPRTHPASTRVRLWERRHETWETTVTARMVSTIMICLRRDLFSKKFV